MASRGSLAARGLREALVGAVDQPVRHAPYAILADAASFVWSAVFIGAISQSEPAPERAVTRSMRRELWEGLRYLVGHRLWRLAGALVVRRIPARFGVGPAIAGSSLVTGPPMLLIPLAPFSYPLPFLIGAIGVCFASVPIVCSPIRSLQVMPQPEELPAITVPFAAPTDA